MKAFHRADALKKSANTSAEIASAYMSAQAKFRDDPDVKAKGDVEKAMKRYYQMRKIVDLN